MSYELLRRQIEKASDIDILNEVASPGLLSEAQGILTFASRKTLSIIFVRAEDSSFDKSWKETRA